MKVKLFCNQGDFRELEGEINTWLKDNGRIRIHHVCQNYAYDNEQFFYTLISIWYYELSGKEEKE